MAGTCGSLPNYIGSPIKAELEAKFGLPTTVANDANCMTLGEVWVGGAKGYTDVIGVTLGTGVGGGILTGGRLLEGGTLPHPRAGWRVLHLRRVGLLGAVRRNHRSGAGRTAPEPEVEGWPRYL